MASGPSWTRAKRQSAFLRPFSRNLWAIATWIPLAIWFNTSVAEVTMIDGPSMYPFLNDNYNESLRRDLVLNYKLYAQSNLARGMVVSLRSPVHPNVISVKRVIGLEGDIVHTRKPFPNSFASPFQTSSNAAALSPAVGILDDEPSAVTRFSDGTPGKDRLAENMKSDNADVEARPPYLHCMLAGGLGGTSGDMLMHSLDTVKTRQQGDPHIPPKYTSLGSSYYKILRQEGIGRGLYGGWLPALLGSFPGTLIFFGTYEFSKRHLLDYGVQSHIAYLSSGFLGDLAASIVYVPSEVLKTRLQLQGRYNNPYFRSGYNYRGTVDAARMIARQEGVGALFYGYKATLYRDLPFSALQFMFWEQGQSWARQWKQGRDIGVPLEFLTGAAAGGLAGAMTCPLDVVKTRLQTQVHPSVAASGAADAGLGKLKTSTPPDAPVKHTTEAHAGTSTGQPQKRLISTSSPSTHTPRPGAVTLETSSVYTGLKLIYRTEGLGGWFRGVGPRFVWTSIQSGCMLFLYQIILRKMEDVMPIELPEMQS
ncbi:uncharacterized protein E0L32_006555 [Thyridium curvatum]|uniref:Peptidase S26 domain-containing protein n=1 Tax=Thyridium curvatum TaxID=1093900 RepID=A0A507B6V4_9PEZI|nr:uncharacterized protein E0L32_006555 [Thyridium curvatum]TPX13129.1 hypothetical protein E0L32_006555 [Thyridium curvatum]